MQAFIDQLQVLLGDEATLRQIAIWLSAASAFILVIGGATIALSYLDPVRKRVDGLAGDQPRKKDNPFFNFAASLGPLAAFILPQDELEKNKVMEQLFHAGFRSATALQVFYLVKTLLMISLPLAVIFGSRWFPDLNTGNVVLYAFVASAVGMLGPNFVLNRAADSRKRKLTNGFPDALDLLVVCVESGLGLAAAIQRVADELDVSHPELAAELAMVNTEIRVGVPREQALKNLARRTGLEDIRGLVGLLVQTMRFGTGVADALRVYSEEFRDKRTQKAEEMAAKMGTKLVFPLVLFMFPIFFIVAVGPAVIRIIDAFSKV
jgi:tight adherence protein C